MTIKLKHILCLILIIIVYSVGCYEKGEMNKKAVYYKQPKESFWRIKSIEAKKLEKNVTSPFGIYYYSYTDLIGNTVNTIWNFSKSNVTVNAYITHDEFSNYDESKPNYKASANYKVQGHTIQFDHLKNAIGLLPKHGLPIDKLTNKMIQLDLDDGGQHFMSKKG